MGSSLSVVMVGATGAVGSEVVKTLLETPRLERLTALGRRPVAGLEGENVEQFQVDVLDPASYAAHLPGHRVAICTLGVGQPSKISKEDFLKIDKLAVLDFAAACHQAGIEHFQLLSSLAADAGSRSFYLRSKGELEQELVAIGFERLSLFQPSMILTPTNRYGWTQGVLLRVWPALQPLMAGPFEKYRGIRVEKLGRAIARNAMTPGAGIEPLHWREFVDLASRPPLD